MQTPVQCACNRERAGAEKRGHHRACRSSNSVRRCAREASSKLSRGRVGKRVWSVGYNHQRRKPLRHLSEALTSGTVGNAEHTFEINKVVLKSHWRNGTNKIKPRTTTNQGS
jgi:hypothetical protein